MDWFRRKIRGKGTKKPTSTSEVEAGQEPMRPYRMSRGLINYKLLFLLTFIVLVGVILIFSSIVQSEVINFIQNDWSTEDAESTTTIPKAGWSEYSAKDAGVVTASDIQLESTVYAVTQTSDDGIADTCDSEGCFAGGGFDGAGALKINTVVSGSGAEASVKLNAGSTSTEWSQILIGNYDTQDAADVDLVGSTVYIADGTRGLKIIDTTTPATPTLTGSYDTSGKALGVAVSGSYAYVASFTAGLHIIDITTPSEPTLSGTYNTPGKAMDVAVSGNYAYVADEKEGLHVIDITVPAFPALVATYDFSGDVYDVAVSGNTAYVAEDDQGLQILDITTPSSPFLISSFTTSGTSNGDIDVIGDYAYMTQDSGGIQIIDISNPAAPVSVGVFIIAGTTKDLAIVGNVAYVAMSDAGLVTLDLSVPSDPALLGIYNTTGDAKGVVAAGNTIYVADGASGLQIIQVVEGSGYSASGTFESPVMDLGSNVYKLTTVASDIEVSAGSLPVGTEISSAGSGVMALWHMNTNNSADTTVADAAGSYDGSLNAQSSGTNTASADMWDSGGKVGVTTYNAVEFDGTDDYINGGYVGFGVQTVMFWINHSSPLSGDEILALNASQSIAIAVSTGEITAPGFASPVIYVDGSTDSAVLSSGWHHVAVVTGIGILASGVNLGRIGTSYMAGKLDEVALYNREVMSSEIEKIYNGAGIKFQIAASDCSNGANNAPNCFANAGWGDSDTPFVGPDGTTNTYFEGPLAHLHFNTGAGLSAQDSSGHGSNGVILIGTSGAQAASSQAWASGALSALAGLGGQGLSLDGTDDYVSVGGITQGIKTIEFWINHASPASGDEVLELSANQYITIKSITGDIKATGFASPTIYVDGSADSATLTTGWNHVAIVTDTAVLTSTVNLGRVGSNYLAGTIDEVAVYDRALTDKDIKIRFNDGLGREGAVLGSLSGAGLDNNQYVKYKATMSSASILFDPQMNDLTIGYSAFPTGAGLVSSVFDTGDAGSFLTGISWVEILDEHDARIQVATSGDNIDWNYCGLGACSTKDWLDFAGSAENYYTASAGALPHSESRDAVNDRYMKYKAWLMSSDGAGTPTVDDITITYDTAHLAVLAPNGTGTTYTAEAGIAFNIIVTVKDSSGNVISSHDGSKTIQLTASTAQPDKEACLSSFTDNGHTEFSVNTAFSSGVATIENVTLCDAEVEGLILISALEIFGGALGSTENLIILDITDGSEEEDSATITWDKNENCADFNHYEVWYDTTHSVVMGIGAEWDNSNDPTLAICSTTTTTITGLARNTKYYFKLYAIDNNGNATLLDITSITITEDGKSEEIEVIEEIEERGGTVLYDVLVKLGDNVHPDPTEDARGSYKHGDVIMVMPAGHNWSDTERSSFFIIQLNLTDQEAVDLVRSDLHVNRRGKRIKLKSFGLEEIDSHTKEKVDACHHAIQGKGHDATTIIEAK